MPRLCCLQAFEQGGCCRGCRLQALGGHAREGLSTVCRLLRAGCAGSCALKTRPWLPAARDVGYRAEAGAFPPSLQCWMKASSARPCRNTAAEAHIVPARLRTWCLARLPHTWRPDTLGASEPFAARLAKARAVLAGSSGLSVASAALLVGTAAGGRSTCFVLPRAWAMFDA
eukprot:s817_g8.t1